MKVMERYEGVRCRNETEGWQGVSYRRHQLGTSLKIHENPPLTSVSDSLLDECVTVK